MLPCSLALHVDLVRMRAYLDSRNFKKSVKTKPSGLDFIDSTNPLLISNNLILPYLIAVWEECFRALFTRAEVFT